MAGLCNKPNQIGVIVEKTHKENSALGLIYRWNKMLCSLIALSLHCGLLIVLRTKITFLSKLYFFITGLYMYLCYHYLSLRHLPSVLHGGGETI